MFIDLYLPGSTTHRINVNQIQKIVMGKEDGGTGAYYNVYLTNGDTIEFSSPFGEIELRINGCKEDISHKNAKAFMERLEEL